MPGQGWFKGFHRYSAAFIGICLAFAARYALAPVFVDNSFIFSVFYLAVVLTAYFAGPGAATITAIASAILAYWAFAVPTYAFKINEEALTSMGFFALTSAIDIYFITGMTRALQEYRNERSRAESLAQANAHLFREFSERTTHHLQLVAALLQLRSREGGDTAYSNALVEASRRTMMISRAHRTMNEPEHSSIDFSAFAGQLLATAIEASDMPDIAVNMSGESFSLPAEQATSVAIILFECFRVVIQCQQPGPGRRVDIALAVDESRYRISLSSPSVHVAPGGASFGDELSYQIVEATADQLHARFTCSSNEAGLFFELAVPTDSSLSGKASEATLAARSLSTMLH